jgi:hypothetical protein
LAIRNKSVKLLRNHRSVLERTAHLKKFYRFYLNSPTARGAISIFWPVKIAPCARLSLLQCVNTVVLDARGRNLPVAFDRAHCDR